MRWACRSGATRPALLRCIITRSSDESSLAHSHLAFILPRPSASRRTGLTGKSNPFAVDLIRSSNAIIKLLRPLLSPSPFTCSLALGSLFLMPRQLRPLAFSTSSRCPRTPASPHSLPPSTRPEIPSLPICSGVHPPEYISSRRRRGRKPSSLAAIARHMSPTSSPSNPPSFAHLSLLLTFPASDEPQRCLRLRLDRNLPPQQSRCQGGGTLELTGSSARRQFAPRWVMSETGRLFGRPAYLPIRWTMSRRAGDIS